MLNIFYKYLPCLDECAGIMDESIKRVIGTARGTSRSKFKVECLD